MDGLKKDAEEERVRLEELERQLERTKRGDRSEGVTSFGELVSAVRMNKRNDE